VLGAGSHDRAIALRLALLLFALLAIFHRGHFMSTDELGLFFQTKSLAEGGSLAVPPRVHMAFPGRGGRSYSQYVVGQSLLAAPFYALGRIVEPITSARARRTLGGPVGRISWQGEPPVQHRAFALLFYPPAVAGALVGVFYLFERRLGVSRPASLAASLALALCSQAALMSTLFLQHATEALLALSAFYFWHRYRASGALRDVLLGSACAATIFNVRAAGALSGLALGGYLAFVLTERARRLPEVSALVRAIACAAAPVAISAALYLALNWLKWGTWLESPQLAERSTLGSDPREALWGFLFSPGMSVFVYSPLLLLAPLTLARFWRTHRAECATVIALLAITLGFYSTYALWTGLYSSPGPRYLFVPMVFLSLALGGWLDAERSALARGVFALLALAGAGVQLVSNVVQWNRLIEDESYYGWQPAFGFVFDWENAPLAAATPRLLDPTYWDVWIARTWQGWPGQPPQPVLALAVLALWAALVVWLALRLRRSFAEAQPA
jgi:hypothetical protein